MTLTRLSGRTGAALVAVSAAALAVSALAACGGGGTKGGQSSVGSGSQSGSSGSKSGSSGSQSGGSGSKSAQTLTWAIPAPPDSLDITKAINATSYTVYSAGLETLVHPTAGKLQPWLAQSWKTPNPLTYVFELRHGVTFWNGKPMTAQDVAFSIERNVSPSSLISYDFTAVKSVTATTATEVTVKLKHPDPLFLQVAIGTDALIVQQSFAKAAGANIGTPDKLNMGTGPFQFTSFSKTNGVKLTRYDRYWGQKPAFSSVNFTVITDPETLRIALAQKQVDGSFDASLADEPRYKQSSAVNVAVTPGLAFLYVSLDVRSAPFNDVHVRKAIQLALDKAAIAKAAGGVGALATDAMMSGPAFSTTFGTDGAKFKSQVHLPTSPNLAAAKSELGQSKSPKGFTTTVRFNGDGATAFQVIKEELAPLGINLKGQQIDDNTFYAEIGKIKQPQGFRIILTGAGSTDPWESLRSVLGDANTSGYSSRITTRGLATLATTTDPAARETAVASISQDIVNQAPFIPLFTYPKMLVLNKAWTYDNFTPRGSGWILKVHPTA